MLRAKGALGQVLMLLYIHGYAKTKVPLAALRVVYLGKQASRRKCGICQILSAFVFFGRDKLNLAAPRARLLIRFYGQMHSAPGRSNQNTHPRSLACAHRRCSISVIMFSFQVCVIFQCEPEIFIGQKCMTPGFIETPAKVEYSFLYTGFSGI
jgi:hypothetical protein